MFKDIFKDGVQAFNQLSFGGSLHDTENIVEMHYIRRSGTDLSTDEMDGDEKTDEKRWHKDPLTGRLSAVDAALATLPFQLIDRNWQWVTTLDLSRNHIEEPDFIVYFERLQTLILDHNCINDAVVFPFCNTLHTLWINFNEIESLNPFADGLAKSFPQLAYLSMMGNPAAPSFLNEGKFHDYIICRLYLISRIKTLTYLDDRRVDQEERKEAKSMYAKKLPFFSADRQTTSAAVEAAYILNPSDVSFKYKWIQWKESILRKFA